MVRFIMVAKLKSLTINEDLHSNMVRFIMKALDISLKYIEKFTFQYG